MDPINLFQSVEIPKSPVGLGFLSRLGKNKPIPFGHWHILTTLLFTFLFFGNASWAQTPPTILGTAAGWDEPNLLKFGTHVITDNPGNGVVDNQFTEGSKDFNAAGCNDPACLAWKNGQTKPKNDIAHAATILIGNKLYFAGDRQTVNGDAQIGFWYYLNGTSPAADGSFMPAHLDGDILVIANFTNGGVNPTIELYQWNTTLPPNDPLIVPNTKGNLRQLILPAGGSVKGVVNSASITRPAGWDPLPGDPNTFLKNQFFEGYVDFGNAPPTNFCIKSFLLETRASQEVTAALDDFVAGSFPGIPSITGVVKALTCNNVCAGEITLTATGGSGTYTFDWDDIPGTNNPKDRTGLCAGTYKVTITDSHNCQGNTLTFTLDNPAALACSITGGQTVCQGDSSTFTAIAGMASYAWTGPNNFTANTQVITVSMAGTYNLTVTDAKGCHSTCSRELTVNPLPVCGISGDQKICLGGSITFTATAGMASYAWTGPNNFTANTQSITVSAAGTYNVTITDAKGCHSTCSRELIVNPLPICGITGDQTVCQGGSVTFTATAGMSSYAWTGPNNFTATTQSITVSVAGIYKVTITNANGCYSTQSRELIVNPLPVCSITGGQTVCQGGSSTFTAIAGMTSYAWTGPNNFTATTQSITVSKAGTYSVTITDAKGCHSTCSRELMVSPLPVCGITGDETVCQGDSATFTATAGMASYAWTGPNNFSANTQSITVNKAGTYKVTITNANGCYSTLSRDLIVNPLPVCSITGSQKCSEGSSSTFTAVAGMASYAWTGPNNFKATTQSITVSVAGTYNLTITDTKGCHSSCSRDLIVNPLPVCGITGDQTVCQGESSTFTGVAGMASYAWTGPNYFKANTQSITVSVPGTYILTITDANGSQSTCSRELTVSQLPVCGITGNETVCQGDSATFTATAGMVSYAWTGPNNFKAATQSITVSAAGNYTVTITNVNGCHISLSRDLIVNPLPVCGITGEQKCGQGGSSTFTATAGMASYVWTGPNNFKATTQSITVSVAGTYNLIITDAKGCHNSCSRDLIVNPLPVCGITGDQTVCQGESSTFTGVAGMASYAWTGPNYFKANTQSITVSVAGTYNLTVTDSNGALSSCSRELNVSPFPTCGITGDQTVCQGDSATFTATAGMASYAWTGPNYFKANTQSITVSAAGTYNVTITNANGCHITISRELNVKAAPVCDITGEQTCNQGGSSTFMATAGMASYAWTGPNNFKANTQSITVSVAGTYCVTITNADGCHSTCTREFGANLGVEEANGPLSFSVYPIPFKDLLTIRYNFNYNTDVKIEMIDILGRILMTYDDHEAFSGKELTLHPDFVQEKGTMYLLRVTTNRGYKIVKVISGR